MIDEDKTAWHLKVSAVQHFIYVNIIKKQISMRFNKIILLYYYMKNCKMYNFKTLYYIYSLNNIIILFGKDTTYT